MSLPKVYEYLDYRGYLRAYYDARKAQRGFSYRVFSRRAGLRSPNYLKLVIDGERNLSAEMARRFALTCGLDERGTRYFEALVAFNQARTVDDRNVAYTKLKRLRRAHGAHELDRPLELYHSRWYLPAIRELVLCEDFVDDPKWIGAQLTPPISAGEAGAAMDILQQMGMVRRCDDGRVVQAETTVSTGPEVRSLHLANFHRTMMEHAKGALDRVPPDQRDVSSLTLCLGREGISRTKRALQRFRRELLELSELEEHPAQVVQVNFQLFPLSCIRDQEDGDETP
ncbi:MAG: TIGR02147 family protein [Myxococcales bacterium]|nr:TIGR02147 family protein [Myxococcales bacterium]